MSQFFFCPLTFIYAVAVFGLSLAWVLTYMTHYLQTAVNCR